MGRENHSQNAQFEPAIAAQLSTGSDSEGRGVCMSQALGSGVEGYQATRVRVG